MLKYVKPIPIIPEFEEYVTGLEPILTEVLLGRMTVDEAMIQSNKLLDEILIRAGYQK